MREYDVVVIGSGPGGQKAAIASTFSEAYKNAALDVMNKIRALNQFRS